MTGGAGVTFPARLEALSSLHPRGRQLFVTKYGFA
jgi:hypothetical protein